jgi:hypothetical protein
MMRLMNAPEPFERPALEFRRKAAIEYVGKTLFTDREHGMRLAARVLAASPMPLTIKPPTHMLRKTAD